MHSCRSLGTTEALLGAVRCRLFCSSFSLTASPSQSTSPPQVLSRLQIVSGGGGQLCAYDLVVTAECEVDLQTALDAGATWGRKFRFELGVGPTNFGEQFGPRRNVPACHVTLGGHELPVVLVYKYLGVILTPTFSWTHAQNLLDRGHRLFAQCVSWCRSEHLPLTLASSIFMTHILASVPWGSEFLLLLPFSAENSRPCSTQMEAPHDGLAKCFSLCKRFDGTWLA